MKTWINYCDRPRNFLKLAFGKIILINQRGKIGNQGSDRKSHQISQKGQPITGAGHNGANAKGNH
jgi:hypothetical protein